VCVNVAPSRARPKELVCERKWLRVGLVRTNSCARERGFESGSSERTRVRVCFRVCYTHTYRLTTFCTETYCELAESRVHTRTCRQKEATRIECFFRAKAPQLYFMWLFQAQLYFMWLFLAQLFFIRLFLGDSLLRAGALEIPGIAESGAV
jgi:hypothetical protein